MLYDLMKLIRFNRPIGTLLLLWPTIGALFIAQNSIPSSTLLLIFTTGVFLTRSAGCIINDILDVNFDKFVQRTNNRPIVLNKITQKQAWIFFLILMICAFVIAAIYLKLLTLLLIVPSVILLSTYPLMKRYISLPQLYLGIAFSVGILMAFVEIKGYLPVVAWKLFWANLLWVFGYDTVYALCDIDDDLKINVKSSAIFFGKYVNIAITICYLLHIIIMISVGIELHYNKYFYIGLIIASLILFYQVTVLFRINNKSYLNLFLLNNWVGMIEFIFILFEVL